MELDESMESIMSEGVGEVDFVNRPIVKTKNQNSSVMRSEKESNEV